MITLDRLHKGFAAKDSIIPVLRGISLEIAKGEVFGIIGRSGAGKSTLVRCINLLERPDQGSVSVGGRDLTALSEPQLRIARRDIGMVFQHFNLVSSRTVEENVALPLELTGAKRPALRARVEELLDLVGLSDKRRHYPAQLSGGQKQRVGIARALASKPSVLLCDEATSALDPETTKSILALLRSINQSLGLTIALITHEMHVIKEIADRVAVLDQGRVVELGRVFDIFTAPQHDVTRAFVREALNRDMPASLESRLAKAWVGAENLVARIIFTGPAANDPVISELVKRFGLSINLLHGHIDYIQGAPYGALTVELSGADHAQQAALDYLRQQSLKVEVLGRVFASDRAVA